MIKPGARVMLRNKRAVVQRIYVERGHLISITVATLEKSIWQRDLDFTVYPREEGEKWARGWSTKAANALRVAWSL